MIDLTRTVAAISTPPGKGGVAVIRVSGDDALGICAKCFRPRGKKQLTDIPHAHAVYGDIYLGDEHIDDGIATVFLAPHSYTGENTVEISCHGGILVTQSVLSAVLASGAKPASPGEFTRRAFISGRISLSEAESIGNLIDAESFEQMRLSSPMSRGRLAKALREIYDEIMRTVSSLYAKIDYPDEELADMTDDEIISSLTEVREKAVALAESYRTGHAVAEGIKTVICGKPNAGKSSLYNLITGADLAIVTEHAGTTRDVLHEKVSLGRVMLNLYDTAGLRSADDPVEKIGVERSLRCIDEAELVIAVFDGSVPLDTYDETLISKLRQLKKTVIAVINKSDIPTFPDKEKIYEAFDNVISLCAKNGSTKELSYMIDRLFTDSKITVGQDAIISSARQYSAILTAIEHIDMATDAFRCGVAFDAASGDMELALGALGEIDGRTVGEDIVNNIFSHFCVGK